MNVVKIFVSLMILFVAVNFTIAIYRFLNRKWREGLENAGECPGSYCMDKGEDSVCHGSNVPCGNNPKAASDIPSSTPAPVAAAPVATVASPNDVRIPVPPPPAEPAATQLSYCNKGDPLRVVEDNHTGLSDADKACVSGCGGDGYCRYESDLDYYTCVGGPDNGETFAYYQCGVSPPSAAQKRVFDDMVSGRSGMSSDPLSDGSVPPPPSQAQSPVGLCNASWEGKPSQPCLDGKCYEIGEECDTNGVCKTGCCSRKDESSPYLCVDRPGQKPGQGPGSGSSTPAAVPACDVMAIHNRSAHNSTYGQWFPKRIQNLNLSQTQYEHAGRKFLNEESIKKGVRTPMVLDSEAEVLGRLLWRVHLAAITQNCMNDSPASVKTTMRDELALMSKVHKIQNMAASTSLNGCGIDTTCQPKQRVRCPTTGMMTQITKPLQGENRPSATTSINSTIPSMTPNGDGTYKYTGYTTDYRPRNPNLKPKPYNSIMDIF